ncbi:hypothetical protein GCM10010411_53680 [Actinomadura fulvescens]|uniref:Uncharacterized protein n=1 Tax=Actinomadura fulvescens TaxID=46160 RepID=A0ABN3Q3J7_9ACTN
MLVLGDRASRVRDNDMPHVKLGLKCARTTACDENATAGGNRPLEVVHGQRHATPGWKTATEVPLCAT